MGKKPKRIASEAGLASKEPKASGRDAGVPRRRWLFRAIAFCMPLAVLAIIELALRAFGYGYPAGFALEREFGGKRVFVDNQQFAQRYFPPGLARSPHPFLFAAKKEPNTIRIFVFGESAAMGDPEPSYGFARFLPLLLKERYPGKNFEVINAGVTAINSHVIRDIARNLAPREGDIWIVYMGNNEVVGPFGAGTVFGAQTPSLAFIRASLAFKRMRLGQALEKFRYRLSSRAQPRSWGGMEMFLKQQIAADDPRMAKVYRNFEANLRDILELGTRAGAKIVLSTVASNLKDCPPFASVPEAPADPEYKKGRGLLARGETNEAMQAFVRARDLDALRFRADTQINDIIRRVAGNRQGLRLLDAVEAVNRASTNGIAGQEFLFEHVHFNFEGNHLMASLLRDAIADVMGLQDQGTGGLDVAECRRLLAFTLWDELQLAEEVVKRFREPPFTHQLDHQPRLARWEAWRAGLEQRWQPAVYEEAVQAYRSALTNAPDDWLLRENFARLLRTIGEPKETERQWRAVIDLMPYYAGAYYSLADVLDAQGRGAEALEFFRRALNAKPDSIEARNGIGLLLANLGRKDEAKAEYRKALAHKPDFAEARVNLGQLLAEEGRDREARAQYALALRYNSNSAAAHINLGKLFAQEKQFDEAISHYRQALRINPANAVAHYNLGNALAATGKPEAGHHFEQAAKHNPQFAEARYNFGLHLAKQNRNPEALAEFAEVVRLKPGFIEAHFNYGVALAKARRLSEAREQFETVLRLDPDNAGAKKLLEQVRSIGGN